MNSYFTQRAWSTGRFIEFLLHSGNRHCIHSPFLYTLIGEVIRPSKAVEDSEEIGLIKKECLNSKEFIQKTDYGKGAESKQGTTYPISVRRIAKTSLTSTRQAHRLYRLARYIKAGRILELGTSLGLTTAYLALANPQAKIITLEGCPELSRKAREHFARLGINNIELIEGPFEDTLPEALERLGRIDMVYIDGNHRKAAMLEYYGRCLQYSDNNTVMIFDDIHASPEMEQAWDFISAQEEVRISLDFFFSGWLFFRKESTREHFKLRYI